MLLLFLLLFWFWRRHIHSTHSTFIPLCKWKREPPWVEREPSVSNSEFVPLLASADVALNRPTIAYQRAETELLVFQALILSYSFFFIFFIFILFFSVSHLLFASRDRLQSFDLEGNTLKQFGTSLQGFVPTFKVIVLGLAMCAPYPANDSKSTYNLCLFCCHSQAWEKYNLPSPVISVSAAWSADWNKIFPATTWWLWSILIEWFLLGLFQGLDHNRPRLQLTKL